MYNYSLDQQPSPYGLEQGGLTPPQQRNKTYQAKSYQTDSSQQFQPIHSQIGLKTQNNSLKEQQIQFSKQSGRLAYTLTKKPTKQPQPQQSQQGFLRKQQSTSTVEDEYITNLQQQIYFLELETKLLKQKEMERTTGLFEGQDGALLSDNIIQLKNKYTQMRTSLEVQVESLTKEKHQLQTQLSTSEKKAFNLQKQLEEQKISEKIFQEQVEQEAEKQRRSLAKITKERDDLQVKLKDATSDKASHKTIVGEFKIQNDKLQSTIKQLQEQSQQLEDYLKQMINEKQEQIMLLQDANTKLHGQIQSNEQVLKLENILKERVLQINNLEIEVATNTNKLKTLEYSNKLLEKNYLDATTELQTFKREKEELKVQLQFEQNQKETLVAQRIKEEQTKELLIARTQIQDLKKESLFYQESFKTKAKEFSTQQDEKNVQYFELMELKNLYEQIMEQCSSLTEEHNQLLIDNKELQIGFSNQQKQLDSIMRINEELKSRNEELSSDNLELICRVEELQKQIDIGRLTNTLNPEELKLLSKQNLEVIINTGEQQHKDFDGKIRQYGRASSANQNQKRRFVKRH